MKIEIQCTEQETDCKVVIDGHPVTFTSLEDAQAYVATLQERVQAAREAFVESTEPCT